MPSVDIAKGGRGENMKCTKTQKQKKPQTRCDQRNEGASKPYPGVKDSSSGFLRLNMVLVLVHASAVAPV
jgi:hypothetical protein